jgi:hypothetical protein
MLEARGDLAAGEALEILGPIARRIPQNPISETHL